MSNSSELVLGVMRALESTGIRWAVLKDEPALALGIALSDIDIVVDAPPRSTAEAMTNYLDASLLTIVLWPYDVGSSSLFIVPPQGGERVQLDLMHDPAGYGKYGILSGHLLDNLEIGERWPAVSAHDSLLYEIRKRIVKNQFDKLDRLVARASSFNRPSLDTRIAEIFVTRAARSVTEALDSDWSEASWEWGIAYRLRTTLRYFSRLRSPVGFWAHVEAPIGWDPGLLRPLLEPLLPHVEFHSVPSHPSTIPSWWARYVAPIRWRAGLVVSWGPRPTRPHPDILIPASEHYGRLAIAITEQMHNRLIERLRNSTADGSHRRKSSNLKRPGVE